MKNKDSRIILEKDLSDFLYDKNKSNLNISFNRIAFVFFIFFFISVIYTIHLIHLGARESNNEKIVNDKETFNNLYRADITDRNGNYIVKTVSSIDVGISTKQVIDKKKLILNLKYIFPNKDYQKINTGLSECYKIKNNRIWSCCCAIHLLCFGK